MGKKMDTGLRPVWGGGWGLDDTEAGLRHRVGKLPDVSG